jgi:predicted RND superfamily exporter protein
VRETLETTGLALLFTSLVLSLGFLIFTLSQMQNLFYFGLFTSFAIASAFLLDILVSPALMVLATRGDRAEAGTPPQPGTPEVAASS